MLAYVHRPAEQTRCSGWFPSSMQPRSEPRSVRSVNTDSPDGKTQVASFGLQMKPACWLEQSRGQSISLASPATVPSPENSGLW